MVPISDTVFLRYKSSRNSRFWGLNCIITYRNQNKTKIDPVLPFEVTKSLLGFEISGIKTSTNSALYGTVPINFDDVSSIYVSCRNQGDASSSPCFYISLTDEILTSKNQIKNNAIWSATQYGNYSTTDIISISKNMNGYKYISLAIEPGYSTSYIGYWDSIRLQ